MPNWALRFFWYFFSVRGRANRKIFWITYLAIIAIILSILLIENVIVRYVYPSSPSSTRAILDVTLLILQLFIWAFLFSLPTIVVRRLHDLNVSGWWLLGYIAVLIFLVGIAIAIGNSTDTAIYKFESTITGLAFFGLGLIPGTAGRNNFGEPTPSRKSAPSGA